MHTDQNGTTSKAITAGEGPSMLRAAGSAIIWLVAFAVRLWQRDDSRWWTKLQFFMAGLVPSLIIIWGLRRLRGQRWAWGVEFFSVGGGALAVMFVAGSVRRMI